MPSEHERLRLASMLAHQFIGLEDLSREANVPYELGKGDAEVRIELRSMVQGLTRHIWVNSAAIATQVEAKLKAAASEVALTGAIDDAVAQEVARLRSQITRLVQEKIEKMVDRAIEEAVGRGPALLAKKVASKMWDAVFLIEKRKKR